MGNHIHLMIKPQGKHGLSKIMQWILSVYALSFNRKFGYSGHVWYDRFHSTIIKTAAYFIKVFQYIAENPVKAEISPESTKYPYGASFFIHSACFEIIEPPDNLLKIFFPELLVKQLPALS